MQAYLQWLKILNVSLWRYRALLRQSIKCNGGLYPVRMYLLNWRWAGRSPNLHNLYGRVILVSGGEERGEKSLTYFIMPTPLLRFLPFICLVQRSSLFSRLFRIKTRPHVGCITPFNTGLVLPVGNQGNRREMSSVPFYAVDTSCRTVECRRSTSGLPKLPITQGQGAYCLLLCVYSSWRLLPNLQV